MGRQSPAENRFRKRVRDERERRGWSQSDLSKLLQENGSHSIYPSTVAKIEAGDRRVAIDEAQAIAELFGVSVDSLLGRQVGIERDLEYMLRSVLATTRQCGQQLDIIIGTFVDAVQELSVLSFSGRESLESDISQAAEAMVSARDALLRIAAFKLPPNATVTAEVMREMDAAMNKFFAHFSVYEPSRQEPSPNKAPRKGSRNAKKS